MALSTSCEAVFDVSVTVADDGSGMVSTVITLDSELADQLLDLDPDSSGLALTDLALSGWEIGRLEQNPDGSIVIPADKPFGHPAQFEEVMADLTAGAGLFDSFSLTREKTFGEVEYAIRGNLDPSEGLDGFSTVQLERDLGVPLTDLIEHYEAEGSDVRVNFDVEMPGVLQADSPTGIVASREDTTTGRWSVSLADTDPTEVEMVSTATNTLPLVLRGVSVVAAALAAVGLLARILRLFRPEKRRKTSRPRHPSAKARTGPPAGAGTGPSAPGDPNTAKEASDIAVTGEHPVVTVPGADDAPYFAGSEYQVVAIDGMGVLYREGNDVHKLLIPFLRQRGATASDAEIVDKVRRLSLGRLTTAEFWQWAGVEGDASELDSAYLALHHLSPGIVRYLRGLRDSGTRVACITNDALGWANKLRAAHSLDAFISPWVVSGSIGVRKPDPAMYEALRRLTKVDPASILLIDDSIENLNAGRKLGFATALFRADSQLQDANGHMLIRSFEAGAPLLRPELSPDTNPASPAKPGPASPAKPSKPGPASSGE